MHAWEQRKADSIFHIIDERGFENLPVLSASQSEGMVVRDGTGRKIIYDQRKTASYKRVEPGSFVIHLRSFQGGFAYSPIEGIASPAYTIFKAVNPQAQVDQYWKQYFTSEKFINSLVKVTYGIRDGRSINVEEFMNMTLTYPSYQEQVAISSPLNHLDSLITLHQR